LQGKSNEKQNKDDKEQDHYFLYKTGPDDLKQKIAENEGFEHGKKVI
jgi:hypothetical protein